MKALVIGPINADFDLGYNKSVARALNQCGFETKIADFYVTTPPGIVDRLRIDLALMFKYRKYYDNYVISFNEKVLALYQSFRPDLVLVIRGSKVTARTLHAMSSTVRVLWCQDAVRRCELYSDQLIAYDRRYVFEASDVSWISEHFNLESHFLPMGFDPEIYHPLPKVKDIDVFFVGAYYPNRRLILEGLARSFPNKVLRFYGRHVRYREPSTWVRHIYYKLNGYGQVFVNRSLNPADINSMYASAKICINMHHSQSLLGCNPRVYEIMGAGAFQLVDAIPYVKQNLSDFLVTYDSYDQLREAINYYLSNEHLCHKSVEQTRQLALKSHTFVHRIREILKDCHLMPDKGLS